MMPATKFFLCLAGACLTLISVAALAALSTRRPDSARKQDADATTTTADGKKGLPHPECQACLRWFRDNLPEPNSLQIIEWGKRFVYDEDGTRIPRGTVILRVKYRAKNNRGGWSVVEQEFHCREGKVGGHLVHRVDGQPTWTYDPYWPFH